MRIISIHRLALQFDADQVTHGTDSEQAVQAVELINDALRRERLGLSAQLVATPDEIEVEAEEQTA